MTITSLNSRPGRKSPFIPYNTEKLTDPFVGRSVPIYRGDPRLAEWFNPKAFINTASFRNDEEAIAYIEAVDKDDTLYSALLNEPPFVGNVVPGMFTEKDYLTFWQRFLG